VRQVKNEAIPGLYKVSRAYNLLKLRCKTGRCVKTAWHKMRFFKSLPLRRGISTAIYTSKSTLSESPMAISHVYAMDKYPQKPCQVMVA
jgi:hypothetical protein